MIHEFDTIPISGCEKTTCRYRRRDPCQSSCLQQTTIWSELLESEGAEAVVPDLIDFMCYCFYNQNFKVEQPWH